MTEKLIELLQKANPRFVLDEPELDVYFQLMQLKKGEILLDFHTVCRHYYFVNKGALRIFFLNNGEECTSWFAFENYFFTEQESYTNGSFSNYCIIAMEDAEILQISKTDMERLLAEYDWWKDFLLYNQQQIIIKLVESVKSFQTQTAQDRYEKLFHHPEFIQRTKQKDLATMLGITRHSLSRLRKKVR